MAIFLPWLIFVVLLVAVIFCSRRLSSRVGAFAALTFLLIFAWGSVWIPYAMTDNPSPKPAALAAAIVVALAGLGCITFRRKLK